MNKLKKFANKVKGKLKIRKQYITIFFFGLIVGGFYQVLKSDPSTRDAILAFATVIMAFAAFWAIQSANSREENRQKWELHKEDRERKERLLNEIIEWATAIHSCNNPNILIRISEMFEKEYYDNSRFNAKDEQNSDMNLFNLKSTNLTSRILYETESRIRLQIVKAEHTLTSSLVFGSDFFNCVAKLVTHLNAHEKLLNTAIIDLTRKDCMVKRAAAHRPYLDQYAVDVICAASQLINKDMNL